MAVNIGPTTSYNSNYTLVPSGSVGAKQVVLNTTGHEVEAFAASVRLRGSGTARVRLYRGSVADSNQLFEDVLFPVDTGIFSAWFTIVIDPRQYRLDGQGVLFEVNASTGEIGWVRSSSVASSPYAAYYSAEFVGYPSLSILSPAGTLTQKPTQATLLYTNMNPSIPLQSYRFRIPTIGFDTGIISSGAGHESQISVSLPSSSFSYGQTYEMEVTATAVNLKGQPVSSTKSRTFTMVSHAPTVTVTAPLSGIADLTPPLQATFNDSLGHGRSETQWEIYDGSTLIGRTVPDFNSLTPTYDSTNVSTWLASSLPLQYGKTYTVRMRAKCSEGLWSSWGTRTFTTADYKPTVSSIFPNTKVDTLLPEITAVYFSSVGNNKKSHQVEIYDSSVSPSQLIADSGIITDSGANISVQYADTWPFYNVLQWGKTYTIRVSVTDTENISNYSEQAFQTNNYPSVPINLSPSGGQIVYSRIPTLSATFNDPNPGDTPSIMEVELRRVSDNTLIFQRTEADANTSFTTFLADNLAFDVSYTWRTRFTDQGGLIGPWSPWATFTTREGVSLTMITPTPGEVLDSPVQTFQWVYSHPAGISQQSGRLRIYAVNALLPLYDSGIVQGSYLSQAIPTTLLKNNQTYRLVLQATDQNGEVGTTGSIYFSTAWETPAQPGNLIIEPNNTEAYLRLIWNTNTSENFVAYNLYRTENPATNIWSLVDSISDQTRNFYNYYYAPSGRVGYYAVTVVENSTGADIESTIETYTEAIQEFPTYTWLHDSAIPETLHLRLQRNPTRSRNKGRVVSFQRPLGRHLPVAHVGEAYEEKVDFTFQLKLPYDDVIETLDLFIARGAPVLYRDGRGVRRWTYLHEYQITDQVPDKATLSLSLTVIDAPER